MGVSLDPRKAQSAHKYGDITVVLSWIRLSDKYDINTEEEEDQRAMFLTLTPIPGIRTTSPMAVVLGKNAHDWNDQDKAALKDIPFRAYKICEFLGIEPSKPNVRRIISIVNDRMQDFLRMPRAQPPEKIAGTYGNMTLKADGQVVSQAPIQFESTGAEYGSA